MSKIELTFIGTDDWSRPVYRDPNGKLWKDVTLGSDIPRLCSASGNDFDGEPDMPFRGEFELKRPNVEVDEELRRQRAEHNARHRREFPEWVKRRGIKVYADAAEAGVETSLKVGDKVTFTNDYGCVFEGHTVLGFHKGEPGESLPENVVYVDLDCYWFPIKLKNLTAE